MYLSSSLVLSSFLATQVGGFSPATRKGMAFVPPKAADTPSSLKAVTLEDTVHTLYYIPSVEDIDYDEDALGVYPDTRENVPAWELSNDENIKIRCMARGANMVNLNVSDTRYVWENVEGAVYYGNRTDNFPYQRGLSLNGGVRFAAVCAEHGLYYDSDWTQSESTQTTADGAESKSVLFTITDDDATRYHASEEIPGIMTTITKPYEDLPTGFSNGAFNNDTDPMSKYPTTNMEFEYNITLVDGEDFARLRMTVRNFDNWRKNAEAWLPMTFPIDKGSKILAHQKQRWRRDEWCFPNTSNIVEWASWVDPFDTCLDWPTGGIFYDFPKKDGRFHGVITDSEAGSGVVYVCPDDYDNGGLPHYTKMWSWGSKENFLAEGGNNGLTSGRPASEYYEPWSSGTNFAFFNSAEFEGATEVSWDVAILPIQSGLNSDMTKDQLLAKVDAEIDSRPGLVNMLGVSKTPLVTPISS